MSKFKNVIDAACWLIGYLASWAILGLLLCGAVMLICKGCNQLIPA